MKVRGYELKEAAGDGRTGRVYRGVRLSDGSEIALRQLSPELAREPGIDEGITRLAADCRLLRNVALVPIIEAFVVEGAVCVVEPWLVGKTLAARIREAPVPPEEVRTLAQELLEALEELHDSDLLHGDVSPANIMLTSRGARLMNIGVAWKSARRRILGTSLGELYDAPELTKTATPDASSDLYGLAASLSAALRGEAAPELMLRDEDPSPLEAVLRRAMTSNPDRRYRSAVAFMKAIEEVRFASPRPAAADADLPPVPRSDSAGGSAEEPARTTAWKRTAGLGALGFVLGFLALRGLLGLLPDVPAGMVEVQAGATLLGDPEGQQDEAPGFEWSHGRFFLDRTEVTVGAYRACVVEGGCTPVGTRLKRVQQDPAEPVVGVTWLQASAYCARQGFRLPSENEWEAASRHFGGRYSWGEEEPHCGLAWYGGWDRGPCGSGEESRPRALREADLESERPVHLAGNVWEFTNSDYEPQRAQGTGELAAAGSSVLKVIKGGAFSTGAAELRSAARLGVELDHWAADVGFRCAGDPED